MIVSYALALSSLWIGGILKGATGIGAPFIAVPVLTALFDIRAAIVTLVFPNLITNSWQLWQYRHSIKWRGFIIPFVTGGIVGVLTGTWLLTNLPSSFLTICAAMVIFGYISLRVTKANWSLSQRIGMRLGLPAGILSGILQGAIGISTPISVTYLNVMQVKRAVFIGSISLLFLIFGAIQLPLLIWVGLMTTEGMLLSLAATAALLAGMPLGAKIGERVNEKSFDKAILILLTLVATSLLWQSF